jgi:hypothetical protein
VAITEKLESQIQGQNQEVCSLRAKVQELEDVNLSIMKSFEGEKGSWMESLKEKEDETASLKSEIKRLQVKQHHFVLRLFKMIF